jgi:hypothetical protein
MLQISIPRIQRYALICGVAGTVITLLTRNAREAAGFLAGALLSLVTIESWSRVAANLNPEQGGNRRPALASGVFLAVRYLVIGACIYGIVKVLGVTPVTILLGLLVSFAAVLVEILRQFSRK